jgi:hypothetical protein
MLGGECATNQVLVGTVLAQLALWKPFLNIWMWPSLNIPPNIRWNQEQVHGQDQSREVGVTGIKRSA